MIYKLHELSRQQMGQLARSQKTALLGHDNYRRFGARLPLHVKFTHTLSPQSFAPGQGAFCYVHRPVMGSSLLITEVTTVQVPPQLQPNTIALTTAVYDLNDPMTIDYSGLDAFVVLIGLEGSCELTDNTGLTLPFCEGEAILIPATAKTIKAEGTIKFLEVYM